MRLGTNTPSTSSSPSVPSSSSSSIARTSEGSRAYAELLIPPRSSVEESFRCLGPARPAPVFSPDGGCRCLDATRLTYSVYASPPPAPPPGPNRPVAWYRPAPAASFIAPSDPCSPNCAPAVPSARRPASIGPALTPASALTPLSLATDGNPVPRTLHTRGRVFPPNSPVKTSMSSVDVCCLLGVNLIVISTSPFAGISPDLGYTSNALFSVLSLSSNSNAMGTLHASRTVLTEVDPRAQRPKSTCFGNLASFGVGYACMGRIAFLSPPARMRTQS